MSNHDAHSGETPLKCLECAQDAIECLQEENEAFRKALMLIAKPVGSRAMYEPSYKTIARDVLKRFPWIRVSA